MNCLKKHTAMQLQRDFKIEMIIDDICNPFRDNCCMIRIYNQNKSVGKNGIFTLMTRLRSLFHYHRQLLCIVASWKLLLIVCPFCVLHCLFHTVSLFRTCSRFISEFLQTRQQILAPVLSWITSSIDQSSQRASLSRSLSTESSRVQFWVSSARLCLMPQ
jgi:hypothetical protein